MNEPYKDITSRINILFAIRVKLSVLESNSPILIAPPPYLEEHY